MSLFVPWLRRRLAWSNSRRAWLDRLAFLGLTAAALLLGLFAPRLAPAAQVLLWGLWLGGAVAAARPFGPVLSYDLVRTARRGRHFVIRIAYLVILLGLLGWLYFAATADRDFAGSVPREQAAEFARNFFSLFMAAQFLIVTVATPAYVAGAIAEEKERRTLEFLLATQLGDREIVLSKLAARLLNLLLLVLTGLPVLAALQLLGGVDPLLVIAGFAATLLTIASLAGLSILASTVCRRARDAIVLTYLLAAAYLVLSGLSWGLTWPAGWAAYALTPWSASPVTLETLVRWFNAGNIVSALVVMPQDMAAKCESLDDVLPGYLRDYALFHGAVALLGPLWAVLRLRALALTEAKVRRRRTPVGPPLRVQRPVGERPMLWKEVFARRRTRPHWLSRATVAVLVLASFVPVVVIGYQFLEGKLTPAPLADDGGDMFDALAGNTQFWVVRVAGTLVACLLLMAVAVRAASGVSLERDQQTLDGLLTTPLDSNVILGSKWLGAVLSVRRGLPWLAALWGVGLLTRGLHPLALLMLIVTWLVYAAFLAGLGTWFSVVCRTTLRATTLTLLTAVAAGLGHWMIWMCLAPLLVVRSDLVPDYLPQVAEFESGLTPPLNLALHSSFRAVDLASGTDNPGSGGELALYGALATATWALLAFGLWVSASRRFRQLAGQGTEAVKRNPIGPIEARPVADEKEPIDVHHQ